VGRYQIGFDWCRASVGRPPFQPHPGAFSSFFGEAAVLAPSPVLFLLIFLAIWQLATIEGGR
jgi:hypothetical protein